MSWEMVKFGKVLEIKNGRDHKKVNTPNGIYPIYGSGGIMGYANEYLCNENATIIGRKGSINNPIFVTKKFWNIDTAFALCSSPSIDPKFLFYFCLTYNFEKHNKATTLPSLTKKDLLEIEIPLPPLSTQQRIAEILDKADALRRKDQALLKKYDDLAQAIFMDMFGDPVKNEMGWAVKRLGEVCTKITDGTHDTPTRLTEGVKFITGKHIRPFIVDYENSDYVTDEVHKEIYRRCNPVFGDVLYTNIGVNYATAAMNTVNYEFSMKNVALLKYDRSILTGRFLEFLLNNERFKDKLRTQTGIGGAQQFLSLAQIKSINVLLPPIEIQKKFENEVSSVFESKNMVVTTISKSEALFQSLLQQAFKGELV